MTEDEFHILNDRWKKLRAKSRDPSVTPAERAAFANKANDIKQHVHAQLGDTFDVSEWSTTDAKPEAEKPVMLSWINQPTEFEPLVFFTLFSVGTIGLIHLIITFEQFLKDIWALL